MYSGEKGSAVPVCPIAMVPSISYSLSGIMSIIGFCIAPLMMFSSQVGSRGGA